jgi:PKD repeat protein
MKGWLFNRFAWLDATFNQNLPTLNADFTATPINALNWQFAAAETSGYVYSWDFDDGTSSDQANPQHAFSGPGNYAVKLTVSTPYGCSNTTTQIIQISGVSTNEAQAAAGFQFFPNPAQDVLNVVLPEGFDEKFRIRLLNILGEQVSELSFVSSEKQVAIGVKDLPPGAYCAEIQSATQRVSTRVLIKI